MKRKRPPSYKRRYKRRKKIFYKKGWFRDIVLFLLFSLSISWLLFKTTYFQIQEVKIAGETKLSNRIQNIVGQNLNFFLLNTSYLSQKIRESFPTIGDIQIQKEFPDKILITIVEKEAIGLVCSQQKIDKCFFLASDGTVFKETKNGENLPKLFISPNKEIKIGEVVVEKKIIENFIFLQDKLKEIKISIEEVYILPYELKVTTEDGFKIYFSRDENLRVQIEILLSALQKTISKSELKGLKYIDVRGIKKDGKGEIYFK